MEAGKFQEPGGSAKLSERPQPRRAGPRRAGPRGSPRRGAAAVERRDPVQELGRKHRLGLRRRVRCLLAPEWLGGRD